MRVVSAALVAGVIGWVGLVVLAASLLAREPAAAGFDLSLILEAAQRVRDGLSPYDPAALSAGDVAAVDLFYSYPPVVAQAVSLPPPASLGVALGALWIAAAGAWAAMASRLVVDRPSTPRLVAVVASTAVLPLVMPMAIGLLFGNLDVLFAAGYGVVLVAVVGARRSRSVMVVGGIALGLMALAKIYPAALGLWLLVLAIRERREVGTAWPLSIGFVLFATVAVVVGLSVLAWGPGPWADYVAVVRQASGVDVIVRANVGPAALVAGWLGLGEAAARLLQLAVVVVAAVALAWAGWTRRDPLVGATVAAVASLVVLPLTWLHYPAALIAFGLAATLQAGGSNRSRPVAVLLAGAAGLALLSVALPALIWVAVGLLVAGVARSLEQPTGVSGR
jgi:hypothetical protein